MGHPNEALVKKGYDAFGKGDLDAVKELLADDIVWHTAGRSEISGDFKGIDEVLGFFGKLVQATDGTFKIEVHDILANDEHGVAIVTASASRGGKSLTGNGVDVYHLKDGKVTEAWTMAYDQQEFDEFMAQEPAAFSTRFMRVPTPSTSSSTTSPGSR